MPTKAGMYKDYLEYDEVTGVFKWLVTTCSTAVKGSVAGSLTNGYRYIQLKGTKVPAHRLAYWWVTGEWVKDLDHIDQNKDNNAYSNLRKATRREQCLNRPLQSNNKSGHKNVSWNKVMQKWKVEFKVNGQKIHVGYYEDIETAVIERDKEKGRYV